MDNAPHLDPHAEAVQELLAEANMAASQAAAARREQVCQAGGGTFPTLDLQCMSALFYR